MKKPIAIEFIDMDHFRLELDADHFIAIHTGLKRLAPSLITDADRRLIQAFQNFHDGLRAEIEKAKKHFPNN